MGDIRRVAALDWMRGIVMVLMAIDHASGAFNGGRLFTDGAIFHQPGAPLPVAQFMTRWITHLCAPAFLFLSGASLAMSVERRRRAGTSVDGHIAVRGILLIAFEVLWMSWVWQLAMPPPLFLAVLWAIGASLLVMVPLRRLSSGALVLLALLVIAGGEALVRAVGDVSALEIPLALLLTPGRVGSDVLVVYPLLPWLAMMMLGWAFGRHLLYGRHPERLLWLCGVAALVVFAVVRSANGYGNAFLGREDHSLVQWLHVSKYPPSLSYTALELGLVALVLAALMRLERAVAAPPAWSLVLGQTALFYYLLHIHALELAAHLFGARHSGGLVHTFVAAAAVTVFLFPVCVLYRRYKQAHPHSLARFI